MSDALPQARPHALDSPAALWSVTLRDRWLWMALGCGALLRLAAHYWGTHPGLQGDEREYYAAAAVLADGRGLSFVDQALWVRPPVYILLLGGLFRLFGPASSAVWIVQSVMGLVSLVLVYVLARLTYFDPRAPRFAVLLAALYWPFAVYAGLLLTETLLIVLLLGSFVALQWWARWRTAVPLLVAGVLLGVAVLTRGLMLGFLLVLPSWFAMNRTGPGGLRAAARAALLTVGVALVVVAPWTVRNALAYQRLIPVETTGGYNVWLAAAGGRGSGQIEATLMSIPNQGDRQAYAIRQGIRAVRERPWNYLTRAASEFVDLWRINFTAYERQTQGYSRGLVPRSWLASTLVFDDLLYLLVLPLAILGWLAAPGSRGRWLPGLWVAFTCVAGSLFFSITRFRIPLMAFVFIFAGGGLAALPRVQRVLGSAGPARRLGAFAALVAALLAVYPTLQPALYVTGFQAPALAATLDRGFQLLHRGDTAGAAAAFETLPVGFYGRAVGLGLAAHQRGDDRAALATVDSALDPTGAALVAGTVARDAGDVTTARAIWATRDFKLRNPLDDAWQWLRPAPATQVDVGGGLDIGYLRGFMVAEQAPDGTSYRWTGPRAEVRLQAPPGGAGGLALRLKSYRPAAQALPPLEVSVNGVVIGAVQPSSDWETHTLPFAASSAEPLDIVLSSRTFVPGYADQRTLGCMIDTIAVTPAAGR